MVRHLLPKVWLMLCVLVLVCVLERLGCVYKQCDLLFGIIENHKNLKSIPYKESCSFLSEQILVTSAEREVKVSRRSGMYQSYNFLTRLGMQSLQVFDFIRLFDEVRAESIRDISRSLRFFYLLFNFFEEERIIILAFSGFEPTHLRDPSDQRRF